MVESAPRNSKPWTFKADKCIVSWLTWNTCLNICDLMAMPTPRFLAQILRPTSITGGGVTSRHVCTARHLYPPEIFKPRKIAVSATALQKLKWACTLSLGDQSTTEPTVDVKQLVDLLCDNFQHMFDDQGIDSTVYDERIMFRDPITKYDTLTGYIFNIHLLKVLFRHQPHLHWVKQVRFPIAS